MYLKFIYLLYKHRNYYYQLLFLLKVISLYYKIKKTKKIISQELGEWIYVTKI